MFNEDILSIRPYLASGLINVSKEFNRTALRGQCNLPMSRKEIKNNIIQYVGNVNDGFILSEFNDGIIFTGDIISHGDRPILVGNMEINTFTLTISMANNIKTISLIGVDEYILTKDYPIQIKLNELYEKYDTEAEIFADVRVAYEIFSKRSSCSSLTDYAREATKSYLTNIFNRFNNVNDYLILDIYLSLTAHILNIAELDKSLADFEISDDKQLVDVELLRYYDETSEYRYYLYENIMTAIDEFN